MGFIATDLEMPVRGEVDEGEMSEKSIRAKTIQVLGSLPTRSLDRRLHRGTELVSLLTRVTSERRLVPAFQKALRIQNRNLQIKKEIPAYLGLRKTGDRDSLVFHHLLDAEQPKATAEHSALSIGCRRSS